MGRGDKIPRSRFKEKKQWKNIKRKINVSIRDANASVRQLTIIAVIIAGTRKRAEWTRNAVADTHRATIKRREIMAQEQGKARENEVKLPDNKENRVEKVGKTNVYPVSEMEGASDSAEVHTPADLGKPGQVEERDENEK